MTALTERRKGDRAVMARQVADLAAEYGLTAFEGSAPLERSTTIKGPHGLALVARFRGNSPQCEPDTYVLSWYTEVAAQDGYRLNPGAFEAVNPHHGHKATDVVCSFPHLLDLLRDRFGRIADGSAFVPPA